jgi:hypothetical protein
MGKRSIAKFLAAVPLTAAIAVNTSVSQNKNDIQFEPDNNQNGNQYFQVDQRHHPHPSIELAIDIAKHNGQKDAKIILAAADNAKTDKVKVAMSKPVDKGNNVSDEQLATMEKMVKGYPIEKMLPYIAKRRPETAAFLVAIAKKESNWGKVSPKSKDGDCFNYWGFKDHRFPFAAGHSCFPSREAAIDSVGNRIDKLVAGGRNTPAKISIWKCGSACASDGNVGKWISDVGMYFNPLMGAL